MQVMVLQWNVDNHPHTLNIMDKQTVLIGRQPDCHVVLNDGHISRQHGEIYVQQSIFFVRTLSKTNPIWINEKHKLEFNKTVPLQVGDVLRIGPIRLQVKEIKDHAEDQLKIRCATCGRAVDVNLRDCPYCGSSLAFGETIVPTS